MPKAKRIPKTTVDMSKHFGFKDLISFTAPSIAMMIFIAIYQIVDGLFVSNYVSATALASVNMAFPVFTILGTLGYMMGTGGSAIIARTYGEGDQERANQLFSLFVYASIAGGLIFTVIGIPLLPLLFVAMGATGDLLDMSVSYGRIIMIALTLDILQFIFQSLTVTAGKPKVGLLSTIAAGVTNIALDALFVGVMDWGIEGAAWATVASFVFGGLTPLVYFLMPNSSLLRLGRCVLDKKALARSAVNGSSEMVSNISISLVTILYNAQLLTYIGESGVAAYSVINYVNLVFSGVFLGYSTGSAPLMSFQHGYGGKEEMRSLFQKGLVIIGVCGLVMFFATRIAGGPIADVFVSYDNSLRELTQHAFTLYSTAFLFMGFNIYASSLFTSLSNGTISALLAFVSTFVFEIGCVFIFPRFFGSDGIWFSLPVAELLTILFSAFFILWLGPLYGILPHRRKTNTIEA